MVRKHFSSQAIWKTLFGEPDLGSVDFQTLALNWKPNQGLAAPTGLVPEAIGKKLDFVVPIYDVSDDKLFTILHQIALAEPNTELVFANRNTGEMRLIRYSPKLKFPDSVRVKIVRFDTNRNSFAIYAQAKMGIGDFGANRALVTRWAEQAAQHI